MVKGTRRSKANSVSGTSSESLSRRVGSVPVTPGHQAPSAILLVGPQKLLQNWSKTGPRTQENWSENYFLQVLAILGTSFQTSFDRQILKWAQHLSHVGACLTGPNRPEQGLSWDPFLSYLKIVRGSPGSCHRLRPPCIGSAYSPLLYCTGLVPFRPTVALLWSQYCSSFILHILKSTLASFMTRDAFMG